MIDNVSLDFDFFEHRHRFAAWAAARAVHAARVESGKSKGKGGDWIAVMKTSSLREFVRSYTGAEIDSVEFERLHKFWCDEIISKLQQRVENISVSFGRVAKFVAVYLKSMVVVGLSYSSPLAFVAYPPIDSVMLKCIDVLEGTDFSKFGGKDVRWSRLSSDDYYALVKGLREWLPSECAFWEIEKYWPGAQQ